MQACDAQVSITLGPVSTKQDAKRPRTACRSPPRMAPAQIAASVATEAAAEAVAEQGFEDEDDVSVDIVGLSPKVNSQALRSLENSAMLVHCHSSRLTSSPLGSTPTGTAISLCNEVTCVLMIHLPAGTEAWDRR